MNVPANLHYSKDHEWLKIDGNVATIGVTDYAQSELGDIVFVEVDTVGDSIDAGEVFGTIEAVKTVSDLFMPVAGEVIEFNDKLEDDPELVNTDPYGEGWLIKIQLKEDVDTSALMDTASYSEMIGA